MDANHDREVQADFDGYVPVADLAAAMDEIERLQEYNERLRAALKPFAARELWRDHYPDASYDRLLGDHTMVDDVYRARAALGAPPEDK
jgi:hypothetical protein